MRKETPDTISDWAEATFGGQGTDQSVCARAFTELAELNFALVATRGKDWAVIRAECADVYIVMARFAKRRGVHLVVDSWVEQELFWVSRTHATATLLSQASTFLLACQNGYDVKISLTGLLARMHQLCALHGGDLWSEVDNKMVTNRARVWVLDGQGHGQHA